MLLYPLSHNGYRTPKAPLNVQHWQSKDLKLFFNFAERRGTTVPDLSNSRNHGNLINGPVWYNRGVDFDGSNDQLDFTTSLTLPTRKTVFFRLTPDISADGILMGGAANNYYPYFTGGTIYLNDGSGFVFGSLSMPAGEEATLTLVGDGTTCAIYKNGRYQLSLADKSPTVGSLCNYSSGGFPFNGKLHEFRYYTRTMTEYEVLELHCHPNDVFQPGILVLTTTLDGVGGTAAQVAPESEQSASGQIGRSGTVDQTVAEPTQQASGQRGVSGNVAQSTPEVEQSAGGQLGHQGTATQVVAPASQAGSGEVSEPGEVDGTAGQTVAPITQSAAGQVGRQGTAAQVAPESEQSASGQIGRSGTVDQTVAEPTQQASGQVESQGGVVQVAPQVTQLASGQIGRTGTVAQATPEVEQSASGQLGHQGTATQVVAPASQAGSGEVDSAEEIVGATEQTIAEPIQSASGKIGHQGSISQVVAEVSQVASGVAGAISFTRTITLEGEFRTQVILRGDLDMAVEQQHFKYTIGDKLKLRIVLGTNITGAIVDWSCEDSYGHDIEKSSMGESPDILIVDAAAGTIEIQILEDDFSFPGVYRHQCRVTLAGNPCTVTTGSAEIEESLIED